MSQTSSSTQLCEVLIDCYRDKENETSVQNDLNAPFTLLRRPVSSTNQVSFQFGPANKTTFDFAGRRKRPSGQSTVEGGGKESTRDSNSGEHDSKVYSKMSKNGLHS